MSRGGGEPPFSKGVHDYYAHYTNNADAKIGALFAFNAGIAALLLQDVPGDSPARLFLVIAIGLQVVAAGFLLNGIYPRLGGSVESVVFWEAVRKRSSSALYAKEVADLNDDEIERAYAVNNYAVAHVLHRKFASIRVALWFTAGAVVAALLSAILGYS